MYCVLRQSMCNQWRIHDFSDKGLTQREEGAIFLLFGLFSKKKTGYLKRKLVDGFSAPLDPPLVTAHNYIMYCNQCFFQLHPFLSLNTNISLCVTMFS